MEKKILNRREAAEYVNMSQTWFDKMRYSGKGPPEIVVGRARRFDRDALRQWIAALAPGNVVSETPTSAATFPAAPPAAEVSRRAAETPTYDNFSAPMWRRLEGPELESFWFDGVQRPNKYLVLEDGEGRFRVVRRVTA